VVVHDCELLEHEQSGHRVLKPLHSVVRGVGEVEFYGVDHGAQPVDGQLGHWSQSGQCGLSFVAGSKHDLVFVLVGFEQLHRLLEVVLELGALRTVRLVERSEHDELVCFRVHTAVFQGVVHVNHMFVHVVMVRVGGLRIGNVSVICAPHRSHVLYVQSL